MSKNIKILVLVYIIVCNFLFSQEIKILDINVEGLERLNKDDIFRICKLYPGISLIRGDEINKSINRLWDIGRFANIQYFLDEESKDGIFLSIIIEELPIVGEIFFIGNKKNKDRTLNEVINFSSGQIISDASLFKAKELIIEKYKGDNYHNINLDIKIDDTETNYIKNVTFYISEGKKIKIKKINITGNSSYPIRGIFKKNKISKFFKNTKEHKWFAFWRGKFNEKSFEEDLTNLESFYKNEGYRDFKVLKKEILYDANKITIDLDLFEGTKYYYKSFEFVGNEKFSDEYLLDILDIHKGEKYNKEKLEFSIYENVTSLYMDEGHYFFNIVKEVIPTYDDSLEVRLIIEENPKVKIRKIFINGNSKTIENVIRRELKIHPNDYFNRGNIIESLKSLYMLDYFSSVEPQILPVSDKEIDISFNLVEKETGRANFSMGYNELNGFSGGGGFEFINFLGRGLRLKIDYQKGLQNQINSGFSQSSSSSSQYSDFESFSISFTEPRIFDSKNSIGFSLYNREYGAGQGRDFDQKKIGGSISFGRQFKWPDYYTSGSWSIGIDRNKYYGSEEELLLRFPENIIYQEGNRMVAKADAIRLIQTIARTNIDNAEFATEGSKLKWVSIFSGGALGGSENYHKYTFNFKWYTPIFSKFVLYQNYNFGVLNSLSGDQYLNPSTLFSMGGSGVPYGEMLRGYLDNSIGTPISTYIRGGNIMLKYSLELRLLVSSSPNIYLLLFAEAGNLWKDFKHVDIFNLKRSAGIGIRLNMPMLGVIGYDIGYGFDHHDEEIKEPWGWEHHLIFGVPLN